MRSHRRIRRLVVVAAVVAAAISAFPASAGAHSFLINSQPPAGARLARAPSAMTLQFSEAFVAGSQKISIRAANGSAVALPPSQASGVTIRQPLPQKLRGVFVVSWRVVSDDGHISLGEFAFAAGSKGALPTISNPGQGTSWSEVAATWLVFVGLALALGGLLSERFVWRRPIGAAVAGAPVRAGILVAMAGAVLQFFLLAGNEHGGGFSSAFDVGALDAALQTRPGTVTVALLALLFMSAVLAASSRLRLFAVVPLMAAVVCYAARGHSGTSGSWWAVVADSIHLAAAAVWVGALVHLVLIARRSGRARETLIAGARRYSRFALPTVFVVILTGIVTAIPEFRSLGSVLSSGYGRTLLIKAGVIGLALLVAATARERALPANPHPRLPLLRRLTTTESAVLAAVLIVAAVLVNAAPPRGKAAAAALPATQLGPPPVPGPSVQLADLTGQLVLALTAGARELQFTIVPPGQEAAGKLKLTADATKPNGRAFDLYPRPCGTTCFTMRFRPRRGTTIVRAHLSSTAWKGGTATFAVPWPLSRERPDLLKRLIRAMKTVPGLTLTESVSSGPGNGARPSSYRISGQAYLKTEPFAGGATNVRVIGRSGALTEVAFALPGSQIWYRVWIDRRFRIRRELIVSPGHLIRRSFRYGRTGRPAKGPPPTNSSALPALTSGNPPPPPPPGAVVLGREDGDLGIGLAIRKASGVLTLQTTVLSPDGGGLSGLDVHYRLRGSASEREVSASPCGDGCYQARVAARPKPVTVAVEIGGAGRTPSSVAFELPRRLPAPAAGKMMARATRVFRGLRSVSYHERLASSPKNVVHTTWTLEAPNKFAYQIRGGPQAILIGRGAGIVPTRAASGNAPSSRHCPSRRRSGLR